MIRGGRTLYGQSLGVLMLDTRFPRIPGDVGNALTWPFPVDYRVVKDADLARIMGQRPDPTLLEPFIDAARELESSGVRAITTSCGFLAIFQRELQAAVSIPLYTSALLQVPMVSRLIRPDQKVAILTERPNLTERHFEGCGWSSSVFPVVVSAMPPDAVFPTVFIGNALEADVALLEREMVELGTRTVREHPDTGAFVLECTNFVPFSHAIRRATALPVFDLYTLGLQLHLATSGVRFTRGHEGSSG